MKSNLRMYWEDKFVLGIYAKHTPLLEKKARRKKTTESEDNYERQALPGVAPTRSRVRESRVPWDPPWARHRAAGSARLLGAPFSSERLKGLTRQSRLPHWKIKNKNKNGPKGPFLRHTTKIRGCEWTVLWCFACRERYADLVSRGWCGSTWDGVGTVWICGLRREKEVFQVFNCNS